MGAGRQGPGRGQELGDYAGVSGAWKVVPSRNPLSIASLQMGKRSGHCSQPSCSLLRC